jgi:hypothetical protein
MEVRRISLPLPFYSVPVSTQTVSARRTELAILHKRSIRQPSAQWASTRPVCATESTEVDILCSGRSCDAPWRCLPGPIEIRARDNPFVQRCSPCILAPFRVSVVIRPSVQPRKLPVNKPRALFEQNCGQFPVSDRIVAYSSVTRLGRYRSGRSFNRNVGTTSPPCVTRMAFPSH